MESEAGGDRSTFSMALRERLPPRVDRFQKSKIA
jgi:hypothetical protein